jgi:ribosomal protein L11 methyltransferase
MEATAGIEQAWLDDTDWVRHTQQQFQPIRISQRLWVVPTWHEPPDPSAVNIVLDPGVAFGTGTHPTTRLPGMAGATCRAG